MVHISSLLVLHILVCVPLSHYIFEELHVMETSHLFTQLRLLGLL